jgi:hypothetical protein
MKCAAPGVRFRPVGIAAFQKALTSQRTPDLIRQKQNPVTSCLGEKATGSDGILQRENPLRPEHLFAGVQKLLSVRAGLLALLRSLSAAFTVARPRGILTRFPILPAFMRGTRTHLKELWEPQFLEGPQLTTHNGRSQRLAGLEQ